MEFDRVAVTPRYDLTQTSNTALQRHGAKSPIKIQTHGTNSPIKIQTHGTNSPIVVKSPIKIQPNDTKSPTVVKPIGREYTNAEISEMLSSGYLTIHRSMWEYIPVGSHIRYYKKGLVDRRLMFRPGGFIRSHFTTSEGRHMMMLESIIGGKNTDGGYIAFPMAYDDIDELFKKYPRDSFIETHLIYSSLAQKKKQIEDLEHRLHNLEKLLTGAHS